jgi:type IV pilus assembly protein PilO
MNNDLVVRFNNMPLAQKVVILALLLAVIGIAFFFGMYEPIEQQIIGQQAELTRLEKEKQRLAQIKANQEEVRAQLERLETQLLIAREKLPNSEQISSLLQRVQNQAKTAGLDLDSFDIAPNQDEAYYVEIPVKMKLRGTYDELANFFYYVGRMTRIVNVRDISMTKLGGELEGELSVSALATTFMYKSGEGSGSKKKTKKKKKR